MTDKELLAFIYGVVSFNKYSDECERVFKILNRHFNNNNKEEDGPSTT